MATGQSGSVGPMENPLPPPTPYIEVLLSRIKELEGSVRRDVLEVPPVDNQIESATTPNTSTYNLVEAWIVRTVTGGAVALFGTGTISGGNQVKLVGIVTAGVAFIANEIHNFFKTK